MATSINLDKKNIWHPYTNQSDRSENIKIVKGVKEFIIDENGEKYIDAISSWWTNLHGHSNRAINKAISKQLKDLEHVIFAGFTHQPAIDLATSLLKKLKCNQQKVFFSDNGSTAVEVGIKMALQYWHNKNIATRKKIIAFSNAYHGDTFGTMAVGERGIFNKAFSDFLFDVEFLPDLSINDETIVINQLKKIIKQNKSKIAAIIFEPLVQGAAGMKMYPAKLLDEIIAICKHENIIVIADEVMTGFGRTGKLFASHYIKNKPDIFCLSKGLTGGYMPMGITTCNQLIYSAFQSKESAHMFYHGHSFTANPISCSASLASLKILTDKKTEQNIKRINAQLMQFKKELKDLYNLQSRCIGTIWAIDFLESSTSYHHALRNRMYNYFIENKILLRPLGNTLYLLPPYCTTNKSLQYIFKHIKQFIELNANELIR